MSEVTIANGIRSIRSRRREEADEASRITSPPRDLGGYSLLALRWLVAAVFIVAGGLKIVDPLSFARAIINYDLAPEWIVPAVAVLLPWWEVAAGVIVLFKRWRLGAMTLLTAMSAAFVILTAITMLRGLSPECGCFGFLSEKVGPLSLALKTALLGVCSLLLWRDKRS